MSLAIKITEVGTAFFVSVEDDGNKSNNRTLTSAHYSLADPDGPEGRAAKLRDCQSYANGVSDGMNTFRSMMPIAHWSGRVDEEKRNG